METPKRIRWNVELMQLHQAELGLSDLGLAKAAGMPWTTLRRFWNGEHRTAKQARRIAIALGNPVRTYIVGYRKPSRSKAVA